MVVVIPRLIVTEEELGADLFYEIPLIPAAVYHKRIHRLRRGTIWAWAGNWRLVTDKYTTKKGPLIGLQHFGDQTNGIAKGVMVK